MTDKALEAALKAWFANTVKGWSEAMQAAISAYLSALPREAEVVAWKHKLTSIIRYDRPNSYDLAQGDYEPLVTLASLQAMQARAEKAEEDAKLWEDRFFKMDANFDRAIARAEAAERERDEWRNHVMKQNDNVAHNLFRAEAAEALVKELERDLDEWKGDLIALGDHLNEQLRETRVRVKELEEALEPFATFTEKRDDDPDMPDSFSIASYALDLRGDIIRVTLGDFRRARTALKGGSNG